MKKEVNLVKDINTGAILSHLLGILTLFVGATIIEKNTTNPKTILHAKKQSTGK
jgi:hypothetical protein